jgi:hypothetical protein
MADSGADPPLSQGADPVEPFSAEPPWLSGSGLVNVGRILEGHRRAWGRPLLALPPDPAPRLVAQELFAVATVVLAHDGGEDPRLIYANRAALSLWRRDWAGMVGMPSRLTAEPMERPGRSDALAAARRQGSISGYGGIRIDSAGRRFQIRNARLWTLWDNRGIACGQAACFADWCWI